MQDSKKAGRLSKESTHVRVSDRNSGAGVAKIVRSLCRDDLLEEIMLLSSAMHSWTFDDDILITVHCSLFLGLSHATDAVETFRCARPHYCIPLKLSSDNC